MKYYKISPEWAQKLNITDKARKHPDGWYLCLPTFVLPLIGMLPRKEYGNIRTIDEAVKAIGGCVYTRQEAIASQRGDAEYMMMPAPSTEDLTPEDKPEAETNAEEATSTKGSEGEAEEKTEEGSEASENNGEE